MPARSRPVRFAGPIVSPNTINFCALPKNLVTKRFTAVISAESGLHRFPRAASSEPLAALESCPLDSTSARGLARHHQFVRAAVQKIEDRPRRHRQVAAA